MIELDDLPELVDPVVVAAFEGWNDAGEAASDALAASDARAEELSGAGSP